ncbi:unnamed protein product [Lasius platythorax]|uniref:Uncharacterized protein n=1 Tax=Lasius platythorax TaxID=488582 RepID=A0AAV2N2E9_9HYME
MLNESKWRKLRDERMCSADARRMSRRIDQDCRSGNSCFHLAPKRSLRNSLLRLSALQLVKIKVSTRRRYDLAALSTVNEPLILVMLLCALNACKTRVCMPVLCV